MTWKGPHSALERFLRYVQIDTESDPAADTTPTTAKQFNLSRLLADELRAMGAEEVLCDEHAYVYATLPATVDHEVPVICFCSHVDTTPDVTGANVRPQVHEHAAGQTIVVDATRGLELSEELHPYLKQHRGHRVVTASGNSLLGADDKAGVAAIMDAAQYLLANPQIPHGKIRVLFTPDEEVGRGTAKVDMKLLGADFGYTLDGAEAGTFEGETFSADAASVVITGVSAHPGYAKGKMVNALRVMAYLVEQLPKDAHSPEVTSGREGFAHLVTAQGSAEEARLEFILRSFDTPKLDDMYALVEEACAKTRLAYPRAQIHVKRTEQYRNLGETLSDHPEVLNNVRTAIERVGLKPVQGVIRGGTDGSKLSFMGMPCPNLFTGMQMIHSRLEWVGERDLNLSAETIVELAQVWAENAANHKS